MVALSRSVVDKSIHPRRGTAVPNGEEPGKTACASGIHDGVQHLAGDGQRAAVHVEETVHVGSALVGRHISSVKRGAFLNYEVVSILKRPRNVDR